MDLRQSEHDFARWSHRKHVDHCITNVAEAAVGMNCNDRYPQDTVDALRHHRMYSLIDPLLSARPGAYWLTVGDGRHGNDAHYIRNKGCRVMATNISDDVLRDAHAQGYIDEYRAENAESLSFADQSFDFVLCKESFHHFPRPYMALYEMLRVARIGIVLIEPRDRYLETSLQEVIFRPLFYYALRVLFRLKVGRHLYEDSGNYVYSISCRELEKATLGLNCPFLATKGLNDFFEKAFLTAKAHPGDPAHRRFRRTLFLCNMVSAMGMIKHRYLGAIILKTRPEPALRTRLQEFGFALLDLPPNPHAPANAQSPALNCPDG